MILAGGNPIGMPPWPNGTAVILALAAGAASAAVLPPRQCVVELRSARLAAARQDADAQLAALRQAIVACPGDPGAIIALLSYGAQHPLPAAERESLRTALAGHLARPVETFSVAAIDRIVRERALEPELLETLLDYLRRGLEPRVDAQGLRSLAAVELARDDLARAATTLERLRAIDSSQDVAWSLLGVYARLERWSDLARLLSGMAAGSTQPELLLPLQVEVSSKAGLVAETMAAIERLSASMRGATGSAVDLRVDLVLAAAWNLRDHGADEEARKLFELALAHDPEQAEARGALVHLYGTEEERRRHGDALADRWSRESDPHLLLEEGTRRLAAGDPHGAYDLLARAAPRLDDLEAAWYNLGMAALRLERWDDAANALGRATEINPERADSFFFRGRALVERGLWAEAMAPLLRSLELDPTRARAHYDLSVCYRETGRDELAARHREAYDRLTKTP
ncbi:MAG TPA: tetratricopeptide repeat protein [Thermoanaerobaculia bacterium]|nr:tetratricopeptide repeat protein [Thermoanaerobaculia bacterium]